MSDDGRDLDSASIPDIQVLLERFVVDQLGPDSQVRVERFERVATGRSRENWLFDLHHVIDGDAVTESLIVRRDPEGGLLETARADEFAVLQALESSSVPSPAVRWLDADGSRLGKPSLIMTRLSGVCDYYLVNGDRPLPARRRLTELFCDLLAGVHQADWQATNMASFLHDPGPDAARHEFQQWQSIVTRDTVEPYPELTVAAKWLERHAPTSPGTVLVHGDFKPGNILLDDEDNITALLDWELAHLGDPHEDLGWVTQPLRTGEHLIPGTWEAEDLFARYEQVTGTEVDRHAVAWWNIFSSYKTAAMQITGQRSFVEGRIDEPYQPSGAVLRQLLDSVLIP
ncbi:MAG: phosphotransferase family protein [Acidimicrobiales bacterium]